MGAAAWPSDAGVGWVLQRGPQPPPPTPRDALTPRPADTCAQTRASGRNCAPEIRCAWILVSPLSFPLVSQLYRKTPAGFRGATGLSDSGRVRQGALTGNKHRLSVSAKVIRKTSEEGQGTLSPHCETPPFLRDTSPLPPASSTTIRAPQAHTRQTP